MWDLEKALETASDEHRKAFWKIRDRKRYGKSHSSVYIAVLALRRQGGIPRDASLSTEKDLRKAAMNYFATATRAGIVLQ